MAGWLEMIAGGLLTFLLLHVINFYRIRAKVYLVPVSSAQAPIRCLNRSFVGLRHPDGWVRSSPLCLYRRMEVRREWASNDQGGLSQGQQPVSYRYRCSLTEHISSTQAAYSRYPHFQPLAGGSLSLLVLSPLKICEGHLRMCCRLNQPKSRWVDQSWFLSI